MYGQMTAGSWIYIGTQGILQGTYETFAEVANQRFGGSLRGRWVLTGGMGGMGGAQPLAATMNEAAILVVEVDRQRIQRRIDKRYCDRVTEDLDEALRWINEARSAGRALAVGLVGNCAEVLPELNLRSIVPDVLTDQTSAHDELNGYIPAGLSLEQAAELRAREPNEYVRRSLHSMRVHCEAMVALMRKGRSHSITAITCAGRRKGRATQTRLRFPASYPRTCVHCSARAKGRSGGPRSPVIQKISSAPMSWWSSCSHGTNISGGGSSWRASGSNSRDSPRASAGWVRVSEPVLVSR
jgi:urocanate hydratase